MTFRERLWRRQRWAVPIVFLPAVLLVPFTALLHSTRSRGLQIGEFLAFLAFLVWTVWKSWHLVACPRCGFNLTMVKLRPAVRAQANFCPHCALEFDRDGA